MLSTLAFFLGLLRREKVNLIGELPLSEILMAVVGPFLILSRPQGLKLPYVKPTLFLGVAWLATQVLSDFVNGTPRELYLRGWANIGMVVLGFVTFIALLPGAAGRRYGAYLIGLAISGAVFVATGRVTDSNPEEYWDLLIASWGGPLVMLIAWGLYVKRPKLSIAVLLTYGAAAGALGARSHGLAFLVAGLAIVAARFVARSGYQINRAMVVRAVLLAGVLFALAFTTYVVTGQRGWLGDKPREQLAALRQPYNPMHVALLARSEAAAAVRAIVDKPILGHGSWARNPGYQAWQEDFLESLTKPGVEITVANRESEKYGLFNGHSHLLQAWAYGGIVGAAFWVFQLYVFARLGLYFIARPWTPALPIVAIGIWLAYWNILFSPMAWGRTTWPALLAFLLILYATSTYQERQPAGVAATV